MVVTFQDKQLLRIWQKLEQGQRLNLEDGILLYQSRDLIGKGRMADRVRRRRHGRQAFYVYNQHLNYTNVCINGCLFCAFSRPKGDTDGFTLSMDDVRRRLTDRIQEPIREIHIVGGLHPDLPFSYYIDLLETVKEVRPEAVIKAFTAVEIDHLASISGLSLGETLTRLKKAGLAMMPGGGAEVLSDRIHDRLFPKKIGKSRWFEILRAAHQAGLTSNATMLYGHIESIEERVRHLIQLREVQDETGGFSAFIPLAFHSKNTRLDSLPGTTAFDDLSNIAVARLMLDNFDHIKAYWVMIGEKLAQLALSFGADDLDGTIIEEKISHMAGATSAKGLTRREMRRMITDGGFQPVERDSFYRPVEV